MRREYFGTFQQIKILFFFRVGKYLWVDVSQAMGSKSWAKVLPVSHNIDLTSGFCGLDFFRSSTRTQDPLAIDPCSQG